jgi:cytochrome c biogenesis protein CcmG, thiol:disulfide interchange protein DsbE
MRAESWLVRISLGILIAICPAALAFAQAKVGQAAPALAVTELGGQKFDLAGSRGQVVVINFWATWCPPCRAEMPALDAVYRKYHDRGLVIVGLSANHLRRLSEVKKVMQSFSYPAAMLADAQVNGFGQPGEIPVTFVIDTHGIVRAKLNPDADPLTEQSLTNLIVPLLPPKPATAAPPRAH